jgi:hypothetical protein
MFSWGTRETGMVKTMPNFLYLIARIFERATNGQEKADWKNCQDCLHRFLNRFHYVMAVTAKRSLYKGIERLRDQEELKYTKLNEPTSSQKEP